MGVRLLLSWLIVVSVAAQAQRDALVIADFEGERLETSTGLSLWSFTDEQFGGTSEARTSIIHAGADNSRAALRIVFRVTDGSPAPFAGVWAMVGPEGLATDLSAYRGVRFYARAKDGGAFTAGLVRFAGRIRRYTSPFTTAAEWTRIELAFGTFKETLPPGAPVDASPFDPKDVTSVGVSVAPKLQGEFGLDIDRLEFYK